MKLRLFFSRQLEAIHLALLGYMAQAGVMLFANTQSPHAKGLIPSPVAMGQEVVQVREEITVASFLTTDIFEMFKIPPGMKVVDWTVDCDALDSNASKTAAFKIGVLNAGKTDLDVGNAVWKTGLTTAQAGGVARMDTVTAMRSGATSADRVVGIIPTAASATFAAGKLGLTVYMAAN